MDVNLCVCRYIFISAYGSGEGVSGMVKSPKARIRDLQIARRTFLDRANSDIAQRKRNTRIYD